GRHSRLPERRAHAPFGKALERGFRSARTRLARASGILAFSISAKPDFPQESLSPGGRDKTYFPPGAPDKRGAEIEDAIYGMATRPTYLTGGNMAKENRVHEGKIREGEAEYEYLPIEDYGVIGDLHTVALVGINGSIDWCCLPHFDSPSIFAAMLDRRKGGRWQIASIHPGTRKQLYFPETNVLITRFLGDAGVGEVLDCMPVEEDVPHHQKARYHNIIRQVTAVHGTITFRMYCEPAFNYGQDPHEISLESRGAVFSTPAMAIGLVSPVPLQRTGKAVMADFTLKAGETASFILRQAESADDRTVLHETGESEKLVEPTIRFWQRW